MCQKSAYNVIESLCDQARKQLHNDIKTHPWFGTHDNVNLPFRVYEQRLHNQSHFDSSTAGTIIVIVDCDHLQAHLRELYSLYAFDKHAGSKRSRRRTCSSSSLFNGEITRAIFFFVLSIKSSVTNGRALPAPVPAMTRHEIPRKMALVMSFCQSYRVFLPQACLNRSSRVFRIVSES